MYDRLFAEQMPELSKHFDVIEVRSEMYMMDSASNNLCQGKFSAYYETLHIYTDTSTS